MQIYANFLYCNTHGALKKLIMPSTPEVTLAILILWVILFHL